MVISALVVVTAVVVLVYRHAPTCSKAGWPTGVLGLLLGIQADHERRDLTEVRALHYVGRAKPRVSPIRSAAVAIMRR